jgi:hypothetical protein
MLNVLAVGWQRSHSAIEMVVIMSRSTRDPGNKEIKQDLDKIEPIFEKFNPEQIDNWRKIWKSKSID